MKKRIGLTIILSVFWMLTAPGVRADEIDYLSFAFGLAAPILAHEAGHEIAGGGDLEWDGFGARCIRPCNISHITAGGFVAEITFAETLNRTLDAKRQRSFLNGLNLSAGLHLFTYAFRDDDVANFKTQDQRWIRPALALAGIFYLLKVDF